jgi:hypothetical protein
LCDDDLLLVNQSLDDQVAVADFGITRVAPERTNPENSQCSR